MNFFESVKAISSLPGYGIKRGLSRMRSFIEHVGLSDFAWGKSAPCYFHVAGTNGKGSTTAYLQTFLLGQKYRTGGFFSPHVHTICERVQFDCELISQFDFARITSLLFELLALIPENQEKVTEFEMKFALGLMYWKEKQAEAVALETGLGGRYDATSIVRPAVNIITSISLDHIRILGSTLEEIAEEKAGILREGIPLMLGRVPKSAREVILKIAENLSCEVWEIGKEIIVEKSDPYYTVITPYGVVEDLCPNLPGIKQPENMALALAALQKTNLIRDPNGIKIAAQQVLYAGSMKQFFIGGRLFILEGAHNAEAAQALRRSLSESFPEKSLPERRTILITGMVFGHDPRPFYEELSSVVSEVFVVPIDFKRAISPDELAEKIDSLFAKMTICLKLGEAIEKAYQSAGKGGQILVTGSFYLVGEVAKILELKKGFSGF